MWSAPITTVAPAAEPLTVAQARSHCRVDATDDDNELTRFIAAAREHIEAETNTRLVTQTVALRCTEWDNLERLPLGPVQSITSIAYVDLDGASQTLSTDVYEARLYDLEPGIVLKHGQQWPAARVGAQITVTAVVGYGAAANVPASLTAAMAMMVHDMNENRGAGAGVTAETMNTVDVLLANRKMYLVT